MSVVFMSLCINLFLSLLCIQGMKNNNWVRCDILFYLISHDSEWVNCAKGGAYNAYG